MERNKLLARLIAYHGVRNTELENLHAGKSPSSEKGDFSDVKVLTPYGEIPWNEVSRISDKEMRVLMLSVEKAIEKVLESIPRLEKEVGTKKKFEELLKTTLFGEFGISWDIPDQKFNQLRSEGQ